MERILMALDGVDNALIAASTALRGHYGRLLVSIGCYVALLFAVLWGEPGELAGIGSATLALGLIQARG
jgi:hypothetical protein